MIVVRVVQERARGRGFVDVEDSRVDCSLKGVGEGLQADAGIHSVAKSQ